MVSSDGEPLTRSADMSAAGIGATAADTASEGTSQDGLIRSSGQSGAAGGLGRQRGSAGAAGVDGGVIGSATGAGGAGVVDMAEPAKAVSMDGDIIGKASEADALTVAAAESPPAGAHFAGLAGSAAHTPGTLPSQVARTTTKAKGGYVDLEPSAGP